MTPIFWSDTLWENGKWDLKIVARNEDYLTRVDPTMVITPRGIERIGSKEDNAVRWVAKHGNICTYANNRFPMDDVNELTVASSFINKTLFERAEVTLPGEPSSGRSRVQ